MNISKMLLIIGLMVSVMMGSSSLYAAGAKKTVAQVLTESAALKGKQVTISGKVIKVNNGIMKDRKSVV